MLLGRFVTNWSYPLLKYIALFSLLFFVLPAYALEPYEWTLDVNTASKHEKNTYGKDKYYNENNNGFGFTYGYSNSLDVKLGYFKNSYHKTSIYAGFTVNRDFYVHDQFVISPGIGMMFSTGYHDTPLSAPILAPVLHPSISIGFKTMRSTVGYIPSGNGVLTFQTQIQF